MLYCILILFLITILIQVIFWVFVFGRFAFNSFKNSPLNKEYQQGLSIIICAKNEAYNLSEYLPFILSQEYKLFEVIVVNDHSTDTTQNILNNFLKHYQNLKVVSVTDNKYNLLGKRNALLQGINAAQYDWLVLTDADCKPATNKWLQYMAAPLHQGKILSIGYSPYFKEKSLLNTIIQYETFYTALQYFSLAHLKTPYMAVGRNMAYTKSFFMNSKKFLEPTSISGDDDLLVNELVTKENFELVIHNDSFVFSKPSPNWARWFYQKIRHLSAGKFYKTLHRIILATLNGSAILLSLLSLLLVFSGGYFSLLIYSLLLIITVQLIVSYWALKKFNNQSMLIWAVVLNFLFPMILITLATVSMFTNTISWKKN